MKLHKYLKKRLVLPSIVLVLTLTVTGVVIAAQPNDAPVAQKKASALKVKSIATTSGIVSPTLPATQTQTSVVSTPSTVKATATPMNESPVVTNPFQQGYSGWYVFNRREDVGKTMPSGGANTPSYCYQVDQSLFVSAPQLYAIACSGNSISFVEQVNDDGSVWTSTMNGVGQVSITDTTPISGWDRVSYRLIPAASVASFKFIN